MAMFSLLIRSTSSRFENNLIASVVSDVWFKRIRAWFGRMTPSDSSQLVMVKFVQASEGDRCHSTYLFEFVEGC